MPSKGREVTGQILWSGKITVPGPRYHFQIYGITYGEAEPEEPDHFLEYAKKTRLKQELVDNIQGS